MTQESIGSRICMLRQSRELTQSQIAQRLHISEDTVIRWETGKSAPDIAMVSQLAELLGVSESTLTGSTSTVIHLADTHCPAPEASDKGRSLRDTGSVSLALLGFAAAVVLYTSQGNPFLAFAAGSFGCFVCILCQALHLLKAADKKHRTETQIQQLQKTAHAIICLAIVLFSGLLPLLLLSKDGEVVSPLRWLICGLLFAVITGAACLLALRIIHASRSPAESAKADLKRSYRRILGFTGVMLLVLLLHIFLRSFLWDSKLLYGEPMVFHDWRAFSDYMQNPLSSNGSESLTLLSIQHAGTNLDYHFTDSAGNTVIVRDALQNITAPDSETVVCTYLKLNQFAYSVSFPIRHGTLPVYVFTQQQHRSASAFLFYIDCFFFLSYALVPLTVFLRNRRNKKNNTKAKCGSE